MDTIRNQIMATYRRHHNAIWQAYARDVITDIQFIDMLTSEALETAMALYRSIFPITTTNGPSEHMATRVNAMAIAIAADVTTNSKFLSGYATYPAATQLLKEWQHDNQNQKTHDQPDTGITTD